MKNNGTKATNISGVNPFAGHDMDSNTPLSMDSSNKCIVFIRS